MDQKRFLTAGEVFQLFGVDSEALNALVDSGDVTALTDRGSFKYRSEDFLRLVQQGKLSPRTAGEMFEVDSKGDIPFLKIKGDDQGMKFDEDVSFIELDEEALNAQARQNTTTPHTPVTPENWFDDLSESDKGLKKSDTQDEIEISDERPALREEATEYELKIGSKSRKSESAKADESDSDVQVFDDDGSIDFSEPDVMPSSSDSDVRLEGPISSSALPAVVLQTKPDSDSDVRIAKSPSTKSDSDVHVAKGKSVVPGSDSDSDVRIAKAVSKKPDSDSDVRIAKAFSGRRDSDSDVRLAKPVSERGDSDSDVRIAKPLSEKSESDDDTHISKGISSKADSDSDVTLSMGPTQPASSGKSPESDSDVKIVMGAASSDSDSDVVIADSVHADEPVSLSRSSGKSGSDSDVRLSDKAGLSIDDTTVSGDSGIQLEVAASTKPSSAPVGGSVYDDDSGISLDSSDSGIRLEKADSGIALVGAKTDSDIPIEPAPDSGIAMESVHDSGISLDSGTADSGIRLQDRKTEKDIPVQSIDSATVFDPSETDSGISLESATADSGISLEDATTDSGIRLDNNRPDSGISLEVSGADSGISVETTAHDSGITLDAGDSGIRMDSAGDSGIRMDSFGDSSISLAKTDSGIAFEEEPSGASATLSDVDFNEGDSGHTQTLDLSGEIQQDSAFDVSLAENEQTMEMTLDDSDDSEAESVPTSVHKGRSATPQKPKLNPAFDIDESLEVEELDISDDLDSVPEAEYSGEFAEADEEVLEAEDEDFSAGEISVAEEDESEDLVPVAKTRSLPREPAWGMVAVAPIICASLLMAITVTVLWGGIYTMWTGGEAPGPAGMLISTLAGFI